MLSLLGTALGFGTSFLPQILDLFKEKQEHKNRMEEMRLQGELKAAGVDLEIKVLDKKAEIEETKAIYQYANPNTGFAAALAATVRPIITYVFFALFVATKIAIMMLVLRDGGDWMKGVDLMFDEESKALLCSILAFWFGNRSVSKFMKR